jgi:2-iminobutanoate/2-iminopropanoate deaminase
MKIISTTEAPEAIGPYSQAMQVGDMLYTSGQIALTPAGEMIDGDIHDQAHQVLKNLGAVLAEVGASYSDVIKTTIFLSDMDDFLAVNTVYAEYFGDHKPARSTVAVRTLPKHAKVEIECIAKLLQYNY